MSTLHFEPHVNWSCNSSHIEPHLQDNVDFIQDHNKNHADELGYTTGINEVP